METPSRRATGGWCSTSPPSAGTTNNVPPVSPTTSAVVLLEPCSLHDTIQDIRTLRSPRRKVKFTGSSDDDSICSNTTTCTQSSKNGRLRGITLDDLDCYGWAHGVPRLSKTSSSPPPTTIVQRKIAQLKEKKEKRRMKRERISRKAIVKPSQISIELVEMLNEVLIRKQRLLDLSAHLRRGRSDSSRSLLSLEYPPLTSNAKVLAASPRGEALTTEDEEERDELSTVVSSQSEDPSSPEAAFALKVSENDAAVDDSNTSGNVGHVSERRDDDDDTQVRSVQESPDSKEVVATSCPIGCDMTEAEQNKSGSELVQDAYVAARDTSEQAEYLKDERNPVTDGGIVKPDDADAVPISSTKDQDSTEKNTQRDGEQDSVEKEVARSPHLVDIEPLNDHESSDELSTTPVVVAPEAEAIPDADATSEGNEESETLQNPTLDAVSTEPSTSSDDVLITLFQLQLQDLTTELQRRDETILKLQQFNTKQKHQVQDLSQQLQSQKAYHEERLLRLQQTYEQQVERSLEQAVGLSLALTEAHVRADELTQQLLNYYYQRRPKQEAATEDQTNDGHGAGIHEELTRMATRQKQRIVSLQRQHEVNSSISDEQLEEKKDDREG